MKARAEPLEIAPTEDGTRLRVRWADGHVSEYPPLHLRINCRCAGCIDELTGDRILDVKKVPPDVYPLEILYVGRYALRFEWSDFHSTGIYPFELLRAICPCEQCQA
ncbi:MAG: DUF971 domain-containing protein [Gemmatimonadetes bacterium]|nr:DUF971 domain-containing protein [Gemmatimonadota bacterium]